MSLELPANLAVQTRTALEEMLRRAASGFTGSLVFDFKDGVPLSVKVTESRRLSGLALAREALKR